jgi:U3 small nucleolar RNA-associated protein 22
MFFPGLQENEKAKDKGLATLNQDALMLEIEQLGRGIFKKITISEQS